jgi:hypothetical protein
MAIRDHYEPIDIHKPKAGVWPEHVPALTAPEAERAARRLWRFALRTTFEGEVVITSGNRRGARCGWKGGKRVMYLNPGQGWRDLVHDLSHWFDYIANGKSEHSRHHARLEARMVREVISRGWLDGKLRDEPKPAPATDDKRRVKLERIEAARVRWERKLKRAENALKKLTRQQRYYCRVLGVQ